MSLIQIALIALLVVMILVKFVKNPIGRIWGYIAISLLYGYFTSVVVIYGNIEKSLEFGQMLFLLSALFVLLGIRLIVIFPLLLIYLAFVKFYKQEKITAKRAFELFSYLFCYASNAFANACAFVLCGAWYIIAKRVKKNPDLKEYVISYIPLTGIILMILETLWIFVWRFNQKIF